MRTVLWLALVAVALVPALARPCDCFVGAKDLPEAIDAGASVVFEGVLARPVHWPTGGEESLTYSLRVTRAWRGVDAGAEVQVTTSTSDCGVHFGERLPVLVAGPVVDGGLLLVQCRRDVWVSGGEQLARDRAQLGAGRTSPSRPPK
jgi:hypothetical protein